MAARRRLRQAWFGPLVCCLVLLLGLSSPASLAQPVTAPVELDGLPLFSVSASKDYTPNQRVEGINAELQKLAQSSGPVQVTLAERNNLPVLALNGQPLLTVTSRDAREGLTPQEQGEEWRLQLQRALERSRRERQPDHVRPMLLVALGFLLAAVLLQRLLAIAWWLMGRRPAAQPPGLLWKGSLRAAQVACWLGATWLIAGLFPITRIWAHRLLMALSGSLSAPFINLGSRSYSILDAVVLVALFVLLTRAVGLFQTVLRQRVLQKSGIGLGAQEAVAFVAQYGLLFIGSLVLLQLWGLNLSSLTLVAGVLGVGVGLGIQGITKNFVSGLVIIFERPIQVGDFVEIGELQGTVQRINLRSVEVVTLNRISIIVPNSDFLDSQVINWSHGSSVSRLSLPVGLAYGSDPELVRAALIEACAGYEGILTDPPPNVLFKGFGDSSLDFHLLVWINQPMRQYLILSDLNFRVESALRRHGLSVPFPQQDLHLRDGTLELGLPDEVKDALQAIARQLPPMG